MSFAGLGLALLLAVHAVVSTLVSLLVAAALPWIEARPGADPARRARALLGLGLLPALGGLAAALGLALPAWIVHEPRGGGESPGPVLVGLAGAGALLVLGRAGAVLLDQWRTLRLVRRWSAGGRPLPGLALPATRFPGRFPVVAVFGLVRGRLFVADRVLRALSREELAGVVAHEAAHHAAHDNLKRLLLRASPDVLSLTAAGARLRRAFEDAAEGAADRRACARVAPIVLARALLKVAASVPPGQRLDAAVAAFQRDGSLAARVRALVAARDEPVRRCERLHRGGGLAALLAALSLPALVAAAAASLGPVHRALESLVHLLS